MSSNNIGAESLTTFLEHKLSINEEKLTRLDQFYTKQINAINKKCVNYNANKAKLNLLESKILHQQKEINGLRCNLDEARLQLYRTQNINGKDILMFMVIFIVMVSVMHIAFEVL